MSHITPKNSEVKWAVCVPSSCGSEDVRKIIQENFEDYLKELPIKVKVQVKDEMCQMKIEKVKIGGGTMVVM